MTGSPVALELRGISHRFGDLLAVERVDLCVAPGELVALIGPSGCGKSTLFDIVAGLAQPDAGEVRFDGRPVADRLGASAYMPQRDALLPWRRVDANVGLPLELQGRRRAEARRVARPLLERFGLADFAGYWPWQLSGGMRHRVAFLRTVISRPGLVLLDEPFGDLDGLTRADLQEWLGDLLVELGPTVALVTHDVAEAVFLADRVVVLTPRPARVAAEIPVGLPRPRPAASREAPEVVALERQVREALHEAAWVP